MSPPIEIPLHLLQQIESCGKERHERYLRSRRLERKRLVRALRILGLMDSQIAKLLGVRQQAVSQWFK
jgi:hypothetical protein